MDIVGEKVTKKPTKKGNEKRSRYHMYVQQVVHLPDWLKSDAAIEFHMSQYFQDCEWAYVYHDKDVNADGNSVEPHIHLAISSPNALTVSAVAKRLYQPVNLIECFTGRTAKQSMYSYLIHITPTARAEGKHVYDADAVRSNFDYIDYLAGINLTNATNAKFDIGEVQARIINGTMILRDMFATSEGALFYANNKAAIDKAVDARYKFMMSEEVGKVGVEVLYIEGASGSGKTTLAKHYASRKYGKYFMSGSSNDTVQDYMGEPVAIFDDARPSDFTASDWLKMLDPYNNKSTVTSRYYNKYLAVKCIIITTTTKFEDFFFYAKNKAGVEEPIDQFMRRFTTVIKVKPKYGDDGNLYAYGDVYGVKAVDVPYNHLVGDRHVKLRYALEPVSSVNVLIPKTDTVAIAKDVASWF